MEKAIDDVLATMPTFTEPTTLDDIKAYHAILKSKLAAAGIPLLCEVKRHRDDEPVEIVIGPVMRRRIPTKL